MMVGSFIMTQKYSVHKTLEKRFRRYLTAGSDYFSLLLELLRGLLREEQRNVHILGGVLEERDTYKIPARCVERAHTPRTRTHPHAHTHTLAHTHPGMQCQLHHHHVAACCHALSPLPYNHPQCQSPSHSGPPNLTATL